MDQIIDAQPAQTRSPTTQSTRVALIDVLRGVALVAMIGFHFSWDLYFLSLADIDITDPGWRLYAIATAASFLVTVGMSLVLAHGTGVRTIPFLRRLAMIAAAAGIVTLASWFTDPEAVILFGVLHHIAVASVLGLAFLRTPIWLVVAATALCFAAPGLWTSMAFNAPGWLWLGLSLNPPMADDYIPLLPWFGCVLVGITVARLALIYRPQEFWARWQPTNVLTRALAFGGRHSLLVYLLHQPLMLGVLWMVARWVAT